MDADILVQLLINAGIPAEQFQLHGLEVYFIDPDANNKPVDAPHESPYDTPENRAIVASVLANYDTLSATLLDATSASSQAKQVLKTSDTSAFDAASDIESLKAALRPYLGIQ